MKKTALIIITLLTLSSCTMPEPEAEHQQETTYIQSEDQLRLEPESGYIPLNYQAQRGQWFPYMHYEEYMYGKSEEEFREGVKERFAEAAANGINTVYLHVHPCGDAYYRSEIFPPGTYMDGEYDPLSIMLEEAHKQKLSAHIWINPLRCQTVEQMKELPDDFIIKKWTVERSGEVVKEVNGRWYLDPSYPETIELICSCVDELLERYQADGIHIDDYFYPDPSPEFDSREFAESGAEDLSEWRKSNCTAFVKGIYDTVKKHGTRLKFGISPQGNINADYNSQYADVRLWGGSSGYCDYIVPQIYFGFENETCPFERTLREWESITENSEVSLIIGLAAYKQGQEDKWAGAAGENEWIENDDIIERQIELVESSTADGYALYY